MRLYGWLIVGFVICHESLQLFGKQVQGEQPMFSFIYNPILFVQAALLMLIGLCLFTFSFRYALVVAHHEIGQTHLKVICGMIYSATLLVGWGWLLWTLLWGGIVIIFLSIFLFVFWD